jgi:hypothetical protein
MSEPPIEATGPRIYLQVQESDDLVLSYSSVPILVASEGAYLADVATDQLDELQAPGYKYLEPNGTIRVEPPPPLPIQQTTLLTVRAQVHTTNDTPTEIYRVATQPNHVYEATLSFLGTNPALAVFASSRRYVFKRLAAGAFIVGEAPLTEIPETATADWDVQIRATGNDVVVEVIGERTGPGDWLVYGQVGVFAPGGLS